MIPSTPHPTESRAELRVFDRLKAAFADDGDLQLTAFHSLNLTRHRYKRFGEIDFLLVGTPGIFVLEVKGGGISCHGGVWYTSNRSGEKMQLRESPFVQAESALHGLCEKLRASLPTFAWSDFTVGYGVIFPDCDWSMAGAEWDEAMLADARTSRNLEGWLARLFLHWHQRDPGRQRQPGDQALTELKYFLRPEFDVAVPLHVQLDQLEERVAAMTEDQMRMLDVVDANPRVICSGGAGTGKTFLALELARRWAASGRQVLLACRSPWLKHWLEARFALPGVVVAVADAARVVARRNAIEGFDALIVDEGQDLLDSATLDRLDSVLDGGLEQGRWCFFHDINNQAGFFGTPDPAALALLETYGEARVPLTTNCRNTRQILEKVQSDLGADMGVNGSGDGPKVLQHRATTQAQAAQILATEIDRLIDRGGLSPGEVTVLSTRPYADSAVALLPPQMSSQILVLDDYALRAFPPQRTSFAEIGNFKGLENEAVIVVDLPEPSGHVASRTEQYVGMSRARSLLILIHVS